VGDRVKHIIAISGPVASGKSVLAEEILKRFSSHRISTRQLLIDAGAENDRHKLIEAGKRFDRETDGSWVLEGSRKYIDRHQQCDVILIDAVRTEQQIDHLREAYGERFVHVHVEVPLEVARARYETRGATSDIPSYDEVRSDPTEAGVWLLGAIADRVVRADEVIE
jgi:adenylosuccinate synthase